MANLETEWSARKAERNYREHRVTFENARHVFGDPHRIEDMDDRFQYDEERWRVIGLARGRMLLVVYTYRGDVIRLIPARGAEKHEEARYYRENYG